MSGLLRRLTRRRPATADENRSPTAESSEPAAAPAETPAEPGGQPPVPAAVEPEGQPPAAVEAEPAAVEAQDGPPAHTESEPATVVLPAATEQPLPAWTVAASQSTAFAAQPTPPRDLPAGVDPGDLAAAPPASARRGKLRRRLRYLRHVRGLLLRDLGGFTYEVHRTAGGKLDEPQRRLVTAKAERISTLDAEVLALESRLGEPHAETLLREPGIGGTCRECGELHASDAHYCSRCGAPLDAKAQRAAAAPEPVAQAVAEPTTGTQTAAEPQPASVLWAGGPRPAPEPEPEATEPPSAVTSQWLATDQPTTFDRAARPEEPVAKADEAKSVESVTQADEPVAPADEPSTQADDPVAPADEAKPAESVAPADEATPDEPAAAKPQRAAKPRKRAPAKPKPESESFEANGRRDDDVPPPISPGDPIASPREHGS